MQAPVKPTRNYVAEAFRIANGNSILEPRREHLLAVIEHCRDIVNAAYSVVDAVRELGHEGYDDGSTEHDPILEAVREGARRTA